MMIILRSLVLLGQVFVHHLQNFGHYLSCKKMHIKLVFCSLVFSTLTACAATPTASVSGHEAAKRDVEAYAIASCLNYQRQPFLKDQGDGWASAVIQRFKGELDDLAAVAAVVKAEVSKGNMIVIPDETVPEREMALPVAYCFDILNTPSVHAAVEKSINKLESFYIE